MVMSGEVSAPESPLDVLSRAASMVESGQSSDSDQSPPKQEVRSSAFKEMHPKFRRHLATPPPYTPPASSSSSSPEEAPLDFSIRKRSLSPSSSHGPPPYKYSNPLRQGSPPASRPTSSSSSLAHQSTPTSSQYHHLPIVPAPSYFRPPPYPRTPSPTPPPPPAASAPASSDSSRPPPPSYEAAMASKPSSPNLNSLTSTSPTFTTLTSRPSPTIKTEYSLSNTSPTPKTDSPPRPSVICTGPAAGKEGGLHIANLFKKEENKENKDSSSESRRSRKREVTIVEESGAVDLMEEHFRKSLGDDYSRVFKESEKKNESEMEVDPVKAFKDDLDMTGYTVDDHFAKALGPAWAKLQEAEKDKKPSVSPKPSQLVAL